MKYRITKVKDFNVIEISGNLETEKEAISALKIDILDLMKQNEKNFIFNIFDLQYIDSSGISIFIDVLHHANKLHGKVFCVVKDDNVKKILSIVGLDKLIKFYNSLDDVLGNNN